MSVTCVGFDSLIKDYYPRPGERIKQYVVDERKRYAWIRETCPRVDVPDHHDNTDAWCGSSGSESWYTLEVHDCCHICGDLADATRNRPDIAAWRAELAARPKPCADRTLLSDEIEPSHESRLNPMLAFLRGER